MKRPIVLMAMVMVIFAGCSTVVVTHPDSKVMVKGTGGNVKTIEALGQRKVFHSSVIEIIETANGTPGIKIRLNPDNLAIENVNNDQPTNNSRTEPKTNQTVTVTLANTTQSDYEITFSQTRPSQVLFTGVIKSGQSKVIKDLTPGEYIMSGKIKGSRTPATSKEITISQSGTLTF